MHDAMIDQTRRIFFSKWKLYFPQRAGRSVRDSSTEMKLCPPPTTKSLPTDPSRRLPGRLVDPPQTGKSMGASGLR